MEILAIGAHYDDVEIGCGGTILKLGRAGHNVHLLVITDSEYTDGRGNVVRTATQAMDEGTRAAGVMGISSSFNLQYKAKSVISSHKLIEEINNILDDIRPSLIFTHWYGDLHEDHLETARASLVAARHYPKVLMYRSNWYHSSSVFNGRLYVDITDVIEEKCNLLKLHVSEYERRGNVWVDFVVARAQEAGMHLNIPYAEEFEVFKYRMDI
jgi:LmbE family N-acetylglucosaminyl deacetylase